MGTGAWRGTVYNTVPTHTPCWQKLLRNLAASLTVWRQQTGMFVPEDKYWRTRNCWRPKTFLKCISPKGESPISFLLSAQEISTDTYRHQLFFFLTTAKKSLHRSSQMAEFLGSRVASSPPPIHVHIHTLRLAFTERLPVSIHGMRGSNPTGSAFLFAAAPCWLKPPWLNFRLPCSFQRTETPPANKATIVACG